MVEIVSAGRGGLAALRPTREGRWSQLPGGVGGMLVGRSESGVIGEVVVDVYSQSCKVP